MACHRPEPPARPAPLTSSPPRPLVPPPQGDQFGYCPPWALAWQYRKLNLLKELLAYDADIMCLQEVQSNHFQARRGGCACRACADDAPPACRASGLHPACCSPVHPRGRCTPCLLLPLQDCLP